MKISVCDTKAMKQEEEDINEGGLYTRVDESFELVISMIIEINESLFSEEEKIDVLLFYLVSI